MITWASSKSTMLPSQIDRYSIISSMVSFATGSAAQTWPTMAVVTLLISPPANSSSAFSRSARAAVVNTAVENNSSADSSSHRRIKNLAISSARSPHGFSQRRRVGVIVDRNFHAVNLLNFPGQREIPPASYVGRIDDSTGRRIKRAGSADPNAAYFWRSLPFTTQQRVNGSSHGREPGFRILVRYHGLPPLPLDLTGCIDEAGSHFGPANIDADDETFFHRTAQDNSSTQRVVRATKNIRNIESIDNGSNRDSVNPVD